MSKIKAKNTLYNDPRYDVVVDSRMLEQHLKEKEQQIAELQKQLAESEDCNNMLNKCLTEKDIEIETQKEENAELKQSQKKLAISKLEMLHDMFCSTINNRILQNYVCSIIRWEIEELKNDGKL